jgi:hypothetical protein
LIEEKSSGVMKVQNITSCLSVDQDADASPIVRKPCWKTDNSSGKWPIPILDRLNLDLSKGQEMVIMSSEKLCVFPFLNFFAAEEVTSITTPLTSLLLSWTTVSTPLFHSVHK